MNQFYLFGKTKTLAVALALFGLFIQFNAQAQLSGTLSIPTNYSTIQAFVTALNSAGVGTGGVILNVPAGHTETLSSTIVLTATGTAANPITIQKSGAGANPLITSYTGGTQTPGSAIPDGMFALEGSDFVTIDGIDLIENASNTSNPSTMEYGYGLFRASSTNACQNVTIMNCTVTLSNANNATGSSPLFNGSVGITMVNSSQSAATTAITPTSTAGAARNNTFKNNTVQNCNLGIGLNGYNPGTFVSYALLDSNNVIGGGTGLGNQILNFGGATSATNPSAGIQIQAQYDFNVSYNNIDNNNGSGTNHTSTLRGIFANSSAPNASGSISNNTLSIKFGGTTSQVSIIENVAGASGVGNTIMINNNTIQNSTTNASATGTWYGIYNTASVANLQMNGNTFTNNSHQGTSGSNYGIFNSGAVSASTSIQNNSFQRIYNGAAAYTGTLYAIYNSGGSTNTNVTLSGNTFTGVNHTVTGTGSIYFLYNTTSSANLTITTNWWNGLTLNHSGSEYYIYNGSSTQNSLIVSYNIINNITRTAASGTFYCYYAGSSSLGTSTQDFYNNTFSNITSTTTGSGTFYGLYTSDGSALPYPRKTIYNNTISNINYNTTGTYYSMYVSYLGDGSGSTGSAIYNNTIFNNSSSGTHYGMYVTSTASPNYMVAVYQNNVYNLASSGTSSTVGAVYIGGNTTQGINFYRNKVHTISGNGTGNVVHGVNLYTTGIYNVYNNIIGNINAPAVSSTNSVNGIYVTSGTTVNLSYNSIYLNASSTGTNFSANGIYSSTSAALTMRNNLVVNTSTASGTGLVAAFRRSSTTQGTYQTSSNSNLFYCGTPSSTNVIYTDGTNVDQTMGDFKNRVSPADAGSVTENPTFLSTVASNTNFLKIDPSVATQIESGGTAIAGIDNDYDGDVRYGSTGYSGTGTATDIGADEGNFIPTDLTGPNIIYTELAFTCTTGNRTISSVSISDASGVVTTGANLPRVYFKKGIAGTWFSQAGSFISGTATSGLWDFTITSTTMGGIAVGDTVYYFIAAQDVAAISNISANPGSGLVATSVSNITGYPSANSYSISSTLSGTYTVGSTGTYSSLTAAAEAYNNSCISGPVVFSLTDASYSTGETFPITFNENVYASSVNTLTIKPAASTTSTVSGASATGLVKLNGADYITIDGSNNGSNSRDLSFSNSTSGTSVSLWNASMGGAGNGANYNTFKNVNIEGASPTTSGIYGIVSSQTTSLTTVAEDNDNFTVDNCKITSVYYGLSLLNNTASALAMDSLLIINNEIGDTASGSGIGYKAIQLSYCNAPSIVGNTIKNVKTTTSLNVAGIELQAGIINGEVSKNVISGIYSTSSSGWGAYGINFSTTTLTTGVLVSNNMISDVIAANYSSSSTTYNAFGLRIAGGTNLKIYNNTIHMVGDVTSGTSVGMSANVLVTTASASGIDARNNILSNGMNFLTSGSNSYNIYSASSTLVVTGIDYNSYSGTSTASTTNNVGYFGTILSTLPIWQGATSQDANSNAVAPNFMSATDLHLDPTANFSLSNLGTPIALVTEDIDNEARNATTPDMGADEFDVDCSGVVSITLSNSTVGLCPSASELVTASISPATTSVQWLLNGGVLSGENDTTITVSSVGNYSVFVVDTTTGCSDTSSAVAVTSLPATTINSDPMDITNCAGLSGSMMADGTGSGTIAYQWYQNGVAISGANSSVLTFNALATSNNGSYTLEITGDCGADTSLAAIVVVSDMTSSATANAIVCAGGETAVTVNTTGGITPYTGTGSFNETAGSYVYYITDSIGCLDSAEITLTDPAEITSSQSFTLCFGESITVGSSTYDVTGVYTDVLTSSEGCDSTVTTDLTVNAAIITTVSAAQEVLTADQANAEYQWIDCANNSAIAGATSQVFTATVNGSYAAIVTLDGCSDTTVCANVTTLGLQNVNANAQVKVYPNPSNGVMTIQVPVSGNYSIVNQLGQKVIETFLIENRSNAITLSEAPGVYYLMGNNKGLSVNYKIVVTH